MSTSEGSRPGSALTFDLRGLVWGIESEVAVITSLCRRIDEHVAAVNAARSEAAERLARLDELVAATDHPDLRAWVENACTAPPPQLTEVFPDRLYAD